MRDPTRARWRPGTGAIETNAGPGRWGIGGGGALSIEYTDRAGVLPTLSSRASTKTGESRYGSAGSICVKAPTSLYGNLTIGGRYCCVNRMPGPRPGQFQLCVLIIPLGHRLDERELLAVLTSRDKTIEITLTQPETSLWRLASNTHQSDIQPVVRSVRITDPATVRQLKDLA